MSRHHLLAEHLTTLLEEAPTFLSIRAVAVVSSAASAQCDVTCASASSVSSIGLSKDKARTSSDIIDALLRLTDLSDWEHVPGRCAVTLPIPSTDDVTLLLFISADIAKPSEEQRAGLERLVDSAAQVLNRGESPDAELARLRREAGLDEILPVLLRKPDVREIVAAVSRVCGDVMPANEVSLQMAVGNDGHSTRYSLRIGGTLTEEPDATASLPWVLGADGLTYQLIHGDRAGRSSVRIPIRFESALVGVLTFSADPVRTLTPADASLGARIGNLVSLALTHERLNQEAETASALRARDNSLAMLDSILGTITEVLDVREVFDRIFELSQGAMPHDAMAIAIANPEKTHVTLYATTGAIRHLPVGLEIPLPDPSLVLKEWEFDLIDDMQTDPRYVKTNSAKAGMRSLIMIPVRLEHQIRGWVNFFSRTPRRFTPNDVSVAGRIAAHIVLALSHQRLAEQARVADDLRARTTNLELLDDLLATVTDSGDLPAVFGRMSEVARKVLPHDGLGLPVLLPDGRHFRPYAMIGFGPVQTLETVEVPDYFLKSDWEFDLIDDVAARPEAHNQLVARLGFRSALRIPIRLDGQFMAVLVFLSRTVAAFKQSDILVGRRIADRVAIALARDREVAASRRADEANTRAAKLEARVRALTDELDARTGYRRVVGDSRQWRQVLTQATQVASTEATVLLLGESGTGKEVVARFLHRGSPRSNGPFIALNCAALPEQLLEAELFGYERGAYTGATQSKPGQLEQAAGGTLFLDEVAEMSPTAQAKFLRVLQEREFQRLGGTRVLRTDARVVAATNRDLQRAIASGQFREDLYYRLNVFAIRLPPLRDRRDDVLPLSESFITEIGRGLGTPPSGISRDAKQLLVEYHWPGNVRELRNILERAAILCDGGLITAEHLALTVHPPAAPPHSAVAPAPPATPAAVPNEPAATAPAGDLQTMERTMIEQALEAARFNKSKAAKALGLTRHQLYIRMRKYGFE